MDMNIKQFKDEAEAIDELMLVFCDGKEPILDEVDAKAKAPEIVETIPPSMRADYSDNVVIAAAQYALVYKEVHGEGAVTTGEGLKVQTGGKVATTIDKTAMPKVSDSELKVINKIVEDMDRDDRINNTVNTKIKKLLYKSEPLALLLGAETVMVHPEISAKLYTKIEDNIIKDEENLKKWEEIKALVADPKSQVPAKLNSSLGRPEGVILKYDEKGEGANKTKEEIFNRERLKGFLFFKTLLRIDSDEVTKLGAKISKVERKLVTTSTKTEERASIQILFTGQKDIKPENYEFINEPVLKADGQFETQDRSISTDLTVKIYVTKTDPETGATTKEPGTQRIKGKYACPVFKRAEKFEKEFGKSEDKNFIGGEINEDVIKEAEQKTQFLLALATKNYIGDIASWGEEMTSAVKELKEASKTAVDASEMGL